MTSPPQQRPPLRILHVSEVHWGGVVTLLRHFLGEQVGHGHDVHLLAPSGMPPLSTQVQVHRWSLDRSHPRTLAPALRELRDLVRELEPDVVHLHSFFAGALGRLPGWSVRRWAPVVYQPHAWSDRLSTRPGAATAVRTAERIFAGATDVLVANCQDEIERGRRFGVRTPATPLGVAVDRAHFRPPTDQERTEARRSLGFATADRVVVVLGRLAWQKGQDLLVPEWCADVPPAGRLALVGPGEPSSLRSLAGDQVDVSVLTPGETHDARSWLWAADLMVLSSRYETVALVVAEAMSTGLPVVATGVDGVAEVLVDGPGEPAGAVVPPEDPASLMQHVRQRLEDPDLRDRESTAGVLRSTRFSPGEVHLRLDDAYREAMTRFAGSRRPIEHHHDQEP